MALVWLGLLWLDVRGLVREPVHPARLPAMILVRSLAVAGGFYLVITVSRDWRYLLAALAGFVVVRFVVLSVVRRRTASSSDSAAE